MSNLKSGAATALQLAGGMQLPTFRRGSVQNMGGVGIANFVGTLEVV